MSGRYMCSRVHYRRIKMQNRAKFEEVKRSGHDHKKKKKDKYKLNCKKVLYLGFQIQKGGD